MIKPLTRLLALACFVSLLAPGYIQFTALLSAKHADGRSMALLAALSIGLAGALTVVFQLFMKKAGPYLDAGPNGRPTFSAGSIPATLTARFSRLRL